MSRIIRARYEGGMLKPLDKVEFKEGEEVIIEVYEDIVSFARKVRSLIGSKEEPSKILSRERDRFG